MWGRGVCTRVDLNQVHLYVTIIYHMHMGHESYDDMII